MTQGMSGQVARDGAQLIVADIGATHARFGISVTGRDRGGDRIDELQVYPTREAGTGLELIDRYLSEGVADPSGICIALAGPVQDGVGQLVNTEIGFSATQLSAAFGVPTRLVNDFAALAAAVPFVDAGAVMPIARDSDTSLSFVERGVRAVVGPGTGLGMAAVLPFGDDWVVLPSEGGHCDFAPTDALEAELLDVVRRERPQVDWETFLSGPGMLNLYHAVCVVWGCQAEQTSSEEVSAAAAAGEPVCHQTLEMFWGLLGSAAGNLALMTGARGGVLVGGGVVTALREQFDANRFRRRFEQRGALTDYARAIPTSVIVDPEIGLKGAARVFRGDATIIG